MGYGRISNKKLARWFNRSKLPGPPSEDGPDPDLVELQIMAERLAIHIRDTTPVCSEQTKAMQFLRDVVHWGIEAKTSHPPEASMENSDQVA